MKGEEFCPNCEEYRETNLVDRNETYTVRGQEISVPVGIKVCSSCGGAIGSDEEDQYILHAVYAEYRRQADLLTPERIKQIREGYRLSQRSFAALLGMSESTINRYEQGKLQDRAHDTAIRACETPEVVRGLLKRRGHSLSEWQRKRVEEALSGLPGKSESDLLETLGEVDWICMPREISDRTGFRRFEYSRFAAAVLWFCRELHEASRTAINKLLFYADFLRYRTATVSLTGTAYRRVRLGPVPADYDGLLSRMESEGLLVREERSFPKGYVGHYYRPGPNADAIRVEFTATEAEVLEHVKKTLGGKTAKDLSEMSHKEKAWLDTEDGQFISYRHAQSLTLSL